MKILIVGLPKSGTTILTYRIAAALDDVVIDFEPQGRLPPEAVAGGNVVTKELLGTQTVDFARYADYDRKIWISRDPRDFLVSQSLYRWYREETREPVDQVWFDRITKKLIAKETDPAAISFQDLEPANYFETLDAVSVLKRAHVGPEWLTFRYEDMIEGQYEALDQYLGFEVVVGAEVADGLTRVVRSKGSGAWRDWFTPADVSFFASGGLRLYMETFGYDLDDWTLNDPQQIDPAHCSQYVTSLFYDYRVEESDQQVEHRPAAAAAATTTTTSTTEESLFRRLQRKAQRRLASSRL